MVNDTIDKPSQLARATVQQFPLPNKKCCGKVFWCIEKQIQVND
jgi:hypothetical protein